MGLPINKKKQYRVLGWALRCVRAQSHSKRRQSYCWAARRNRWWGGRRPSHVLETSLAYAPVSAGLMGGRRYPTVISLVFSAVGRSCHHLAPIDTRMLRAGCAQSSAHSCAIPVATGFSSILPSVVAAAHIGFASVCVQGLPVILSVMKLTLGEPIAKFFDCIVEVDRCVGAVCTVCASDIAITTATSLPLPRQFVRRIGIAGLVHVVQKCVRTRPVIYTGNSGLWSRCHSGLLRSSPPLLYIWAAFTSSVVFPAVVVVRTSTAT